MILRPLQKIQVIESKKKCKTGSLGYFVAQDPVGNYNAWNMCIVFTRFGKKGKPRIEPLPINSLMIDYNTMKPADRDLLNIARIHGGLEPRIYTDRRGNAKDDVREAIINPIQSDGPKDLLDLPDSEFTAYIVSMSMFIYKLIYNKPTRSLHLSPRHVRLKNFAAVRFDFATIAPENFGYYILGGMKMDEDHQRRSLILDDDLNFGLLYARQIDSTRKKTRLLDRLQRSLAMAKDRLKLYDETVLHKYNRVPLRINDTLKFYRRNKKELANIKKQNKNALENPTSHYNIRSAYAPRNVPSPKLVIADMGDPAEEIEI